MGSPSSKSMKTNNDDTFIDVVPDRGAPKVDVEVRVGARHAHDAILLHLDRYIDR